MSLTHKYAKKIQFVKINKLRIMELFKLRVKNKQGRSVIKRLTEWTDRYYEWTDEYHDWINEHYG